MVSGGDRSPQLVINLNYAARSRITVIGREMLETRIEMVLLFIALELTLL